MVRVPGPAIPPGQTVRNAGSMWRRPVCLRRARQSRSRPRSRPSSSGWRRSPRLVPIAMRPATCYFSISSSEPRGRCSIGVASFKRGSTCYGRVGAIDAVRQARQRCWRYDWVLDIDVKAYFDSIDWERLLKAVRHHTDCPWVLLYIERWLKAPVQMEDGSVVPRTAGTPPCKPVPALCVRCLDVAKISAHSVREIRGRCHLSLQERRRGAGVMERVTGSLCGLQAGAASREDEDRLLQGCEPRWRLSEPVVRLSRVYIPGEEGVGKGTSGLCVLPARRQSEGVDVHQPNNSALGASSSQRQVPAGPGRDVQPVHSRLDQLLQPLLQDAVASDPEEDRSLCHPLGAPQVQAVASQDQGGTRLV